MKRVKLNSSTMVSLLLACGHLGYLQQGNWFHDYIIGSAFNFDIVVVIALIDMYCKCVRVEIARQLFDEMPERNVVPWSAMIAGSGMHGCGEDVVALFCKMQQTDLKPDQINFCLYLVCVQSRRLGGQGLAIL